MFKNEKGSQFLLKKYNKKIKRKRKQFFCVFKHQKIKDQKQKKWRKQRSSQKELK